jgi:hypothetical protein
MTLAVAELLRTTTYLSPCGQATSENASRCLWFSRNNEIALRDAGIASENVDDENSEFQHEDVSEEFFLGVLVGLACYNNLYIDVPLPPAIYKVVTGAEVSVHVLSSAVLLILRHPVHPI